MAKLDIFWDSVATAAAVVARYLCSRRRRLKGPRYRHSHQWSVVPRPQPAPQPWPSDTNLASAEQMPGPQQHNRSNSHGLRSSNKLLYKRCAKSMGRPKFRPPTAANFSTDLNETWNQERYPGYDSTCKIWLTGNDGKGVCTRSAFSATFGFFPFFAPFPSSPHVWGSKLPKTWFLWAWIGILSQICEIFESQYLKKVHIQWTWNLEGNFTCTNGLCGWSSITKL